MVIKHANYASVLQYIYTLYYRMNVLYNLHIYIILG